MNRGIDWLIGRAPGSARSVIGSMFFLGVIMLLWEFVLFSKFMPRPSDVLALVVKDGVALSLAGDALYTGGRVLGALAVGGAIGYALALYLSLFAMVTPTARVAIGFLFAYPKLSVFLHVLIVSGFGERSNFLANVWVALVVTLHITFGAIRAKLNEARQKVTVEELDACALYFDSRWEFLRKYLAPQTVRQLFLSLTTASLLLWNLAIFVESTTGLERRGIGARVWLAFEGLALDEAILASTVIALCAAGTVQLLHALERLVAPLGSGRSLL